MTNTETRLLWEFAEQLRGCLPESWRVRYDAEGADPAARAPADASLALEAPDGAVGRIAVEVKASPPTPKAIERIAAQWSPQLDDVGRPDVRGKGHSIVVVCDYLSPGARDACTRFGMGYADATGALRLQLARPAVFIERAGAGKNPRPRDPSAATMRGTAAARLARALVSVDLPVDGASLATRTSVSASQVSKVLGLLAEEGLIEREPRGPVLWVDRPRMIERWAQDDRGSSWRNALFLLGARGIDPVLDALRTTTRAYAVSGAVVANRAVRLIQNPRLLIYADDPVELASELPARPAEKQIANVLVAAPPDASLLLEAQRVEGLSFAPWSQVVVDLLGGAEREPSAGEKLLDWLGESQDGWRALT